MKEYSKGIYVKFKPEEVEILHDRMKEAGVQNMSAYIRKMALENILEEQGEARRFTKEEEKKILIYTKPWMDEFLNGKLIALTKEKEDELREKYKEKYGEYPPEPKDEFLIHKSDELLERYKENVRGISSGIK